MDEEYKSKVFKSGNSLALRLPKALGLEEGEEVTLVSHDAGSFFFWRQDRAREVLMELYGSMSAGFMADGRDDTAQDDRDWSHAATQAA